MLLQGVLKVKLISPVERLEEHKKIINSRVLTIQAF